MIPKGRHTDWPWPFSFIPRSWNAWASNKLPKQLLGNAKGHLDIPAPGEWTIDWPPYVAIHRFSGWYARFGIRYDYVDHYYTFPALTIKKYVKS